MFEASRPFGLRRARMSEILRLEKIEKSFGRRRVLQDVSLSLEAGRVYGLLGKNGEGKTTIIRIVMGVIPADGGAVTFQGLRVPFGASRYKTDIGYVPEDPFFYSWMKVGELLDFNASFYPRWDSARALEFLGRFSLDGKARIGTLSRGMKLKLHLAVALAARPALLILDDATSGIDVPTRHDFLRDIVRELADGGTAILFSTHLVHELERIVEHLFILHGGRMILNEDFEKVKSMTKRIALIIGDEAPAKFDLDGMLGEERERNRVSLLFYPWDEEKRRKLEEMSPAGLEVESLSLEEIFESFVKR
jgi:ABC-2 type transport system ATP-binding protein